MAAHSNAPELALAGRGEDRVAAIIVAETWATRINARWRQSVEAILDTGRLLIEAKADLPHGGFETMIASALAFRPRTAQMLMAVAESPLLSNAKHVSLLPPAWSTLYALSRLPEPILERALGDGTVTPQMQRKDVKALMPASAQTVTIKAEPVARTTTSEVLAPADKPSAPTLGEASAACWAELQRWGERHGKTIRTLRMKGVTDDYFSTWRRIVRGFEGDIAGKVAEDQAERPAEEAFPEGVLVAEIERLLRAHEIGVNPRPSARRHLVYRIEPLLKDYTKRRLS